MLELLKNSLLMVTFARRPDLKLCHNADQILRKICYCLHLLLILKRFYYLLYDIIVDNFKIIRGI